jgi:hypothetical protein
MAEHIVRAAFDQGQVPTIACINNAKVGLGVDFTALIAALQKFVNDYFAPVWGTHAKLVIADDFINGAWALVFLDDADVQDALGYHDLTPDGLPLSKVFVKTTLASQQKVSVTACHEVAEMLVDPAINLWAEGTHNELYAYEMSDAVEEVEFDIDGIAMSDFVYPSYFEAFREPHSTRFDYCHKVTAPLELLPGGYTLIRVGGRVTQKFGSLEKAARFTHEDRRGHRSQYRTGDATLARRSTYGGARTQGGARTPGSAPGMPGMTNTQVIIWLNGSEPQLGLWRAIIIVCMCANTTPLHLSNTLGQLGIAGAAFPSWVATGVEGAGYRPQRDKLLLAADATLMDVANAIQDARRI